MKKKPLEICCILLVGSGNAGACDATEQQDPDVRTSEGGGGAVGDGTGGHLVGTGGIVGTAPVTGDYVPGTGGMTGTGGYIPGTGGYEFIPGTGGVPGYDAGTGPDADAGTEDP